MKLNGRYIRCCTKASERMCAQLYNRPAVCACHSESAAESAQMCAHIRLCARSSQRAVPCLVLRHALDDALPAEKLLLRGACLSLTAYHGHHRQCNVSIYDATYNIYDATYNIYDATYNLYNATHSIRARLGLSLKENLQFYTAGPAAAAVAAITDAAFTRWNRLSEMR